MGARMINARAESLREKPAWRELLEARRCLVLADGYYEWSGEGKARSPWFFHLSGNQAFVMAGLWDRWSGRGETIETCTIITTEAGVRASAIHHRMPVLLRLDAATEWLDTGTPESRLLELLTSYDSTDLECHEVSRYVNTPANDSPECIAPVSFL
jgi:putative SOS response-associated peptidase YedK